MSSQRPLRTILAMLVAATALLTQQPETAAQGTATTSNLQALVNDTAAQFQLSYRQDPAERQRRHEQLAAIVKSWRAVERTEANNRLLADWLRAAMRSSMPGSQDDLPERPAFGDSNSVMHSGAAGRETSRITGDKALGNPFGDDPQPANE